MISELNRIPGSRTAFLLPVDRDTFLTKEYPNYTRAWLTFGLLDAGYGGRSGARFGSRAAWAIAFNRQRRAALCERCSTSAFRAFSPAPASMTRRWAGAKDVDTAVAAIIEEDWWLDWLLRRRSARHLPCTPATIPIPRCSPRWKAICDLYRATGKENYLQRRPARAENVRGQMAARGRRHRHVRDGRLLPRLQLAFAEAQLQRAVLDQLLGAAQPAHAPAGAGQRTLCRRDGEFALQRPSRRAGRQDRGFHYLNFLQRTKDWRWLDRCYVLRGAWARG